MGNFPFTFTFKNSYLFKNVMKYVISSLGYLIEKREQNLMCVLIHVTSQFLVKPRGSPYILRMSVIVNVSIVYVYLYVHDVYVCESTLLYSIHTKYMVIINVLMRYTHVYVFVYSMCKYFPFNPNPNKYNIPDYMSIVYLYVY